MSKNISNDDNKNYKGYLGHRVRLKERFLKNGLSSLSNYEVLELLLIFSIPRKDVKPIAKELIKTFGNLDNITKTPPKELQKIFGVGKETSTFLNLIGELSKNIYQSKIFNNSENAVHIGSKNELLAFLRAEIGFDHNEIFLVLFLNASNNLIKYESLFKGTIDRSAVYPRVILEKVIEYNARSVIFVHNHPSGNVNPSRQDIELTNSMSDALKMFDVSLIEHIIVSKNKHFSFIEEGLL